MPSPQEDITQLLESWTSGAKDVEERLFPLVYDELRRMAGRYVSRERRQSALQATALVNEAYLRLVDQESISWQGRSQFFAISATMMRRILVDHARKSKYAKRGGDVVKVSLDEAGDLEEMQDLDLVALNEALEDLAKMDREKAALVELRYFAGLSLEETAEILGCSRATVVRQWRVARAWLYRQLTGSEP